MLYDLDADKAEADLWNNVLMYVTIIGSGAYAAVH